MYTTTVGDLNGVGESSTQPWTFWVSFGLLNQFKMRNDINNIVILEIIMFLNLQTSFYNKFLALNLDGHLRVIFKLSGKT